MKSTVTVCFPESPDGQNTDALHKTLMAELRCAWLRARLVQLDFDAMHTALDFGLVTVEQAMAVLDARDLLDLLDLDGREAA